MRRKGTALWLTIILLFSLIVIIVDIPQKASAYTPHDPIEIDGDLDFANQAANEGWVGDGSKGDPYIIEGYEINTYSKNGIDIRSTTVYFVIKDTHIFGYDWSYNNYQMGIYLDNITNGIIENCSIENNLFGIGISSSMGINIFNNNFTDNFRYGLYFEESHEINIFNNNITYLWGNGMFFSFSDGNNIFNNNISSTYGGRAINLFYSTKITYLIIQC
jgi:parallel beta-helix repeat protein